MINGTLKKDFYEKSEEYKKNIEILLNEEEKNKRNKIIDI